MTGAKSLGVLAVVGLVVAFSLSSTLVFCCVEAVQNAAKHAGPGASVTVWLDTLDGHVVFGVDDDACGFDPRAAAGGHGSPTSPTASPPPAAR